MTGQTAAGGRGDEGASGLGRYVATWLIAGLLVVVVGMLVLGDRHRHEGRHATVAVPPVKQVNLGTAVRRGRCTLALRHAQAAPTGPASARPGVLARPLPRAVREAALRRGFIVIEYRRTLPDTVIGQLRTIQATVPAGTVLAPAPTGQRDAFLAASAARELRCLGSTGVSLDALRLFRGRFLGTTHPAR